MYLTKEFLYKELSTNKSLSQIARETNSSLTSVRYWRNRHQIHIKRYCKVCRKELINRQISFCSSRCKSRYNGSYCNNMTAQYNRGLQRKFTLLQLLGNRCSKCGYNKNIAALCFHHVDSSTKELELDMRSLSNNAYTRLLAEAKKCVLLCHNCHAEVHNPDYNNLLI